MINNNSKRKRADIADSKIDDDNKDEIIRSLKKTIENQNKVIGKNSKLIYILKDPRMNFWGHQTTGSQSNKSSDKKNSSNKQ